MDNSKMENTCVWEENKKFLYIKCMWCIDEFSTYPGMKNESEVFSPMANQQTLDFQLSLTRLTTSSDSESTTTTYLQIQFPRIDKIDFEWQPFLCRPSDNKQLVLNDCSDDISFNRNNCKRVYVSWMDLKTILPTLQIVAGCYLVIEEKIIQDFKKHAKGHGLYFSKNEIQNFQTKWDWSCVEGMKLTSSWALPDIKLQAQYVSHKYSAGSNADLTWNFIVVNHGSLYCDPKLNIWIKFQGIDTYSIDNLICKLSIVNPTAKTTKRFTSFIGTKNTLRLNNYCIFKRLQEQANPLLFIFDAVCLRTSSHRLDETLLANFQKIPLFYPHFSDVKLKIGDQEILAHKLILSAASPIFFEMLATDKNLAEIEINDENSESMARLVDYCYNYKEPDMDFQEALDVLKVTHKYQVKGLKQVAERILIGKIDEDSMIDLLILGETYDARQLKESVLNYIELNRKSIDDKKFAEIVSKSNSSTLLLDIIKKLITKS